MKRPLGVWVCLLVLLLLAGIKSYFAVTQLKEYQDFQITSKTVGLTYWLFGLAVGQLFAAWGVGTLKPWGRGVAMMLAVIDFFRGVTGLFGDSLSRAHAVPAMLGGVVIFYFLVADTHTKEAFKPESLY